MEHSLTVQACEVGRATAQALAGGESVEPPEIMMQSSGGMTGQIALSGLLKFFLESPRELNLPEMFEVDAIAGDLAEGKICAVDAGPRHDAENARGFFGGGHSGDGEPVAWEGGRKLRGQDGLNDVAGDVSEAEIAAGIAIGQLGMIDAHEMEDGGVIIMDMNGV